MKIKKLFFFFQKSIGCDSRTQFMAKIGANMFMEFLCHETSTELFDGNFFHYNFFICSDSNYRKKSVFSFVTYHPYGISTIVHDSKNNLLIVAGNYGKEPYENDSSKLWSLANFNSLSHTYLS